MRIFSVRGYIHLLNLFHVATFISARRQLLRQKGNCFRCLRNGHLAVQFSKECHICGLGHHSSICENPVKEKQSTPQGRNAVTNEGVACNLTAASFQASSTSMFVSSKSSALLQTARTNISKPGSGEHSVNARMVFDSGSQTSCISENLRNSLKLPVAGQDTLLIKTFGESTAKVRQCDIVQLAVEAVDGMQIYISAYAVPMICAPISNQIIEFTQANYPHLQCLLRITDNSHGDEGLSIDILIGADFYWYFLSGSIVRGPELGPSLP